MKNKFCERLRELRTEKELSQKQMGEVFKVAHNTISSWERGNSLPSINELTELAKFFEVFGRLFIRTD